MLIFYSTTKTFLFHYQDNTGERDFIEDMAFPTLDFPSDHAVLATVLERKY
jgi:hypothetical protein